MPGSTLGQKAKANAREDDKFLTIHGIEEEESTRPIMVGGESGGGRGPVSIVRSTTSVTSGQEVTQKLISAASAFGQLMEGTFGPQGLDKMLYKSNGETAITNDGAKIIAELLVKHPAAKAFVQLAEAQEQSCGNGVTTSVLLASSLLKEAGMLLEKRLHPLVVVEGYQQALEQCLDWIDSNANQPDTFSNTIQAILTTSMNGTMASTDQEHLTKLLIKAFDHIDVEHSPRHAYENIRMTKRRSGAISDTRCIPGLIIDQNLHLDGQPHSLTKGKIACLTCPIEYETTSRDAEIQIISTEQYSSFIQAKKDLLAKKTEQIRGSGATMVFSSQNIEPSILHTLSSEGIVMFGNIDESLLEDIALASSSELIDHLDDLSQESCGRFEHYNIEVTEGAEGRRERAIITIGEHSNIATIDVGGDGGEASEEVVRNLYDAMRSATIFYQHPTFVYGGGATFIGAALHIRQWAERNSTRERLAIEAFARSLERIPSALSGNAGKDKLDTVLELRSLHREGQRKKGVCADGTLNDMDDVVEPTYTVLHAIELATDTACGLLRVDQVISSRGD